MFQMFKKTPTQIIQMDVGNMQVCYGLSPCYFFILITSTKWFLYFLFCHHHRVPTVWEKSGKNDFSSLWEPCTIIIFGDPLILEISKLNVCDFIVLSFNNFKKS